MTTSRVILDLCDGASGRKFCHSYLPANELMRKLKYHARNPHDFETIL